MVLEHKYRSTIVMTKRGEFIRAKKVTGADVGEEVTFEPKPSPSLGFFTHKKVSVATIAIIMIFSMFPAYFWYGNNQAYASVSIDINPSIEAKVNRDMEIISIRSMNEDGKSLLANLPDFEGEKLTAVTSKVFRFVEEKGLLSNGKSALIGVSYLTDHKKVDVSEEIQGFFDKANDSFKVATYTIPYEWMEEAEEKGTSVHSVVNERMDNDRKMIDLEEDDRELIRSFFQKDDDSEKLKDTTTEESTPAKEDGEKEKNPTQESTEQPSTDREEVPAKQSSDAEEQKRETSPSKANSSSVEKENKGKTTPEPDSKGKDRSKEEKQPENNNGNGNGPPSKNGDHPGNNGNGHGPPTEGEDHPSKKGENHPGNKGKDHPSSNGKGNGPPHN